MEGGGAIRCNWDGYVAGVRVILDGWYTDAAKIEKLLALGNLSRLGTKIVPEPGMTHTFAHPQPDVTAAYHCDRGERMVAARRYAGIDAYCCSDKSTSEQIICISTTTANGMYLESRTRTGLN